MRFLGFLIVVVLVLISSLWAQPGKTPLTRAETCAPQYAHAVVPILAGGGSLGTGFVVSKDGYIVTAAHVVMTHGEVYPVILVLLPDGNKVLAHALPPTPESLAEDFVILKVEAKAQLPFLALAEGEEVKVGSDLTMVGYPFGMAEEERRVGAQFCLDANVAAVEAVPRAPKPFKRIFLQGAVVRGLSGSPLISRESGNVVGFVTSTVNGMALQHLSERLRGLAAKEPANQTIQQEISEILSVVEHDLPTGIGAGTGVEHLQMAVKEIRQRSEGKQ